MELQNVVFATACETYIKATKQREIYGNHKDLKMSKNYILIFHNSKHNMKVVISGQFPVFYTT